MNGIRTLNLLWEKRFRGVYPVSAYALANDGTLTCAVPRPLEARAYDITRLHTDGTTLAIGGFNVETLLELELAAGQDSGLGMTADDLYLFHNGQKGRFLGEKRLSFVDSALSADGQSLVTAFSDMAGASFTLAYGDITGRAAWLRAMDVPLTAVALSRDGRRLTVGSEPGTLWLTDSGKRDVWEFLQPEPVRALAASTDGLRVAYGTLYGNVGLIDGTGSRLWETRLNGEIIRLALAADGSFCAALVRIHEGVGGTQVVCLLNNGQVGWEYLAEKPPLGISLSPDGRFLATGTRDGTLTVFAVVPGEAAAGETTDLVTQAVADAHRLSEAGDIHGAFVTLYDALRKVPGDTAFVQDVAHRFAHWKEEAFRTIAEHRDAQDYLGALTTLEKMLTLFPRDAEIVTLYEVTAAERTEQLVREAKRLAEKGDVNTAETTLLEAVALTPFAEAPHAELNGLRSRYAAETDADAETRLAQGDLENGVAALERAQAAVPTPERARRIAQTQLALEFAVGMEHYNEKRYQQAIFQFKKTLARDPEHREAKRYLNFAEKFLTDAASESLTDRFSRLE